MKRVVGRKVFLCEKIFDSVGYLFDGGVSRILSMDGVYGPVGWNPGFLRFQKYPSSTHFGGGRSHFILVSLLPLLSSHRRLSTRHELLELFKGQWEKGNINVMLYVRHSGRYVSGLHLANGAQVFLNSCSEDTYFESHRCAAGRGIHTVKVSRTY